MEAISATGARLAALQQAGARIRLEELERACYMLDIQSSAPAVKEAALSVWRRLPAAVCKALDGVTVQSQPRLYADGEECRGLARPKLREIDIADWQPSAALRRVCAHELAHVWLYCSRPAVWMSELAVELQINEWGF